MKLKISKPKSKLPEDEKILGGHSHPATANNKDLVKTEKEYQQYLKSKKNETKK